MVHSRDNMSTQVCVLGSRTNTDSKVGHIKEGRDTEGFTVLPKEKMTVRVMK